MLFQSTEIFDILVMAAVIGYLFKDIFNRYGKQAYDPLNQTTDYRPFMYAVITVGSSILLHELFHKFIAMSLGLTATFHAAYNFLFFGLLLRLMGVGYIFFVPAYVSHTATTGLNSALIAFGGPLANLLIWLACYVIIKENMAKKKYLPLIYFTKYINGFLFVVNMLPIPGLDGFWVYTGLLSLF
ncbi:MAG: M50 family metallopeptidase [Candidatus Woesearchaeota archaeon]